MLCGSYQKPQYAGMAELADARDLKSRGHCARAGSTPVSRTTLYGTEICDLIINVVDVNIGEVTSNVENYLCIR